jgi:hypothetical protein
MRFGIPTWLFRETTFSLRRSNAKKTTVCDGAIRRSGHY